MTMAYIQVNAVAAISDGPWCLFGGQKNLTGRFRRCAGLLPELCDAVSKVLSHPSSAARPFPLCSTFRHGYLPP